MTFFQKTLQTAVISKKSPNARDYFKKLKAASKLP